MDAAFHVVLEAPTKNGERPESIWGHGYPALTPGPPMSLPDKVHQGHRDCPDRRRVLLLPGARLSGDSCSVSTGLAGAQSPGQTEGMDGQMCAYKR